MEYEYVVELIINGDYKTWEVFAKDKMEAINKAKCHFHNDEGYELDDMFVLDVEKL